jgi:hypothetical protein
MGSADRGVLARPALPLPPAAEAVGGVAMLLLVGAGLPSWPAALVAPLALATGEASVLRMGAGAAWEVTTSTGAPAPAPAPAAFLPLPGLIRSDSRWMKEPCFFTTPGFLAGLRLSCCAISSLTFGDDVLPASVAAAAAAATAAARRGVCGEDAVAAAVVASAAAAPAPAVGVAAVGGPATAEAMVVAAT